jgi:hypothetical protein
MLSDSRLNTKKSQTRHALRWLGFVMAAYAGISGGIGCTGISGSVG